MFRLLQIGILLCSADVRWAFGNTSSSYKVIPAPDKKVSTMLVSVVSPVSLLSINLALTC